MFDSLVHEQTAAPAPASAPSGGMFDHLITKATKKVDKAAGKVGGFFDSTVGKALVQGHKDPLGSFLGIVGAPQRALQSAELGQWDKIGHNFMTPSTEKSLAAGVKKKIGLDSLEHGALAGSDLLHKTERGILDTGLDIVNDPLTFLPVGRMAKFAAERVPMIARAGEAIGNAARNLPGAGFLDNEAELKGLTTTGRGTLEAAQNLAKEAGKARVDAGLRVIAKHADEIRNGSLPVDVQRLFSTPGAIPQIKKGMRVQDVVEALRKDDVARVGADLRKRLAASGLMAPKTPPGVRVTFKNTDKLFKDPSKVDETRVAINKYLEPTPGKQPDIASLAQASTRAANKAFLALPFAHGSNLTNLAYNRYGPVALARGLVNAARVATGHVGTGDLAKNIAELERTGAKSQYGNVFDELGISRLAGIKGTEGAAKLLNKGLIIPLERAANKAQNSFLNPLETGLRSAALDTERRLGNTGVDAARNIHRAFGSDAPNRLSKDAEQLGTGFAKFHAQTAVGSGLRTLATNPGRALTLPKADRDMNAQINPGASAKFHLSTPSMDTARALTDPTHYFATLLGPLADIGASYSALSQAQKGKVSAAVSQMVGRYVPAEAAFDIALKLARGERGQAGEAPTSDIPSLFTGGYYQKPK